MAFAHLKSRVLVAVAGVPIVIVCVLIGKIPFMILFTGILIGALIEFYQLAQKKNCFPDTIFSILIALLLLWDMYLYQALHFVMIISLYVVIISILQLKQTKGSQLMNLSMNLWGVIYLGVLMSFFVAIRELPLKFGLEYKEGGYWALSILIIFWIGDSVAYFVGSSIGKHKLASRVIKKLGRHIQVHITLTASFRKRSSFWTIASSSVACDMNGNNNLTTLPVEGCLGE